MRDMGCSIMGMRLFVDDDMPADEVRIVRAKHVLATAFGLMIPKQEGNAIQAADIPDAREARLLALVEKWEEGGKAMMDDYDREVQAEGWRMKCCAADLLAALRGDA